MKDFLEFIKNIVMGIILMPVIVYGGLFLIGVFQHVLDFSFNEAVIATFLTPIVLFIVVHVLGFLLGEILEAISEALEKSHDLKSFLMYLLLGIIGRIIVLALLIGILWLGFEILKVLVPVLILLFVTIGFVGALIGVESPESRRERIQSEINDLEQKRDRIATTNGFFGDGGLSESELRHNRHKRDKLDEQIQDKQRELNDLQ